MDVDLARTFLAVTAAGSFLEAAERVHVTQSTVSARIRTLEERLGRPLFERGHSGAALTPAGRRFHRHAVAFVRTWTQAKIDAGLPETLETSLRIGAPQSLWDGYLMRALPTLMRELPAIALIAETGYPDVLATRLIAGDLDLAVAYRPHTTEGLLVERVLEDEFALVTSDPDTNADPFGDNYVFVDWSPEFRADHIRALPSVATPRLQLAVGTLGLQYLQAGPATGYFPMRIVEPEIRAGRLRLVETAPRFAYAVYAMIQETDKQDAAGKAAGVLLALGRETVDEHV